jgi:peptidoglycan LD-endopeptidase LytH
MDGSSPAPLPSHEVEAAARSLPFSGYPRTVTRLVPTLLLAILSLSGCANVQEVIDEALRGETPHARYLEQIERAGLGGSRLSEAWKAGAEEALRAPLAIPLPHEELGYRWPEEAGAIGFEVNLQRGERLTLTLESEDGAPLPRIYAEIYRVRNPGSDDGGASQRGEDPRSLLVAYNDPEAGSPRDTEATGHDLTGAPPMPTDPALDPHSRLVLTHNIRVSGTYRIRIHPELLAEFSYRLSLSRGPSLAFPVEGRSTRSILSFFGQARDGGRREHHGVDIFAPRGTPVLAAGPGRVRRVQETPIGGRVVWILDEEMGVSRYYAHLDTQWVETGQWVESGDPIGTVGNTGNARTTPPHLHFGLYLRGEGPVDPWMYLHDHGARPRPPRGDPEFLGRRMHHPELGRVRVEAIAGDGYRVRAHEAPPGIEPMALVDRSTLEDSYE